MQINDTSKRSNELAQRRTSPTPEDLVERIIVSAHGLEQISTERPKASGQSVLLQWNVRERLSCVFMSVRPAWTMPLFLLVGFAMVGPLGLLERGATTHTNPFAEMDTQELAMVIADLELQEIWLLQDELTSL